jgi:hypothetical protein
MNLKAKVVWDMSFPLKPNGVSPLGPGPDGQEDPVIIVWSHPWKGSLGLPNTKNKSGAARQRTGAFLESTRAFKPKWLRNRQETSLADR